jgi:integrating conjugative element protein (TIGR03752 family)
LEQQNRKMASVEDAVSSSPTLDADSIKASILSVLQKNLPELMPQTEGITTKSPSDEYSITDKEVKPVKETRTRLRSYGLPIDAKGQISPVYLKSLDNAHNDSKLSGDTNNHSLTKQNSPTVDPRFTIPADAALFDSVTITALVGRIPRDGDVNDPSPFKVAIGRDNLAANGFSLPGIDGMIMSGIVYGDAVRKCVRTKITRATYIFEDGRILTLPKKRKGKVIGYLADPQGDPCIRGHYITNGNAQLTKSILANMAAGAANAFAETQTTSQTNSLGGTTKSVTGDNKKFVIGSAVSSGASSVATLLNNQQFDQWDQVVVGVGKTVTIHIDEQLEIDNASNLRKISYENEHSFYGLTD